MTPVGFVIFKHVLHNISKCNTVKHLRAWENVFWRQVWDYEFIAKALIENYNSDVTVMTDSLLNNITVSDGSLASLCHSYVSSITISWHIRITSSYLLNSNSNWCKLRFSMLLFTGQLGQWGGRLGYLPQQQSLLPWHVSSIQGQNQCWWYIDECIVSIIIINHCIKIVIPFNYWYLVGMLIQHNFVCPSYFLGQYHFNHIDIRLILLRIEGSSIVGIEWYWKKNCPQIPIPCPYQKWLNPCYRHSNDN